MKIIQVGPWAPPYGGIAIHIKDLKHLLWREGIHCEAYTYTVDKKEQESGVVYGVNYWALDNHMKPQKDWVFHTHPSTYGGGFDRIIEVGRFAGKHGLKHIATLHGAETAEYLERKANPQQIDHFARGLRFADHIICVNDLQSKMIQQKCGVPSSVISVIPSYLSSWEKDVKINCNTVDFIRSFPQIITANITFHPMYGVDVLIEAIPEVLKRCPHVGFIFIGGGDPKMIGSCRKRMEELGISNNVLFTGGIPHSEVLKILRFSRVCVRPSRSDSLGLCILEAVVRGNTVIVSDIPARKQLESLIPMMKFKNEDSHDLAVKIKTVCEIPKTAKIKGMPSPSDIRRVMEYGNSNYRHILEVYKRFGGQA